MVNITLSILSNTEIMEMKNINENIDGNQYVIFLVSGNLWFRILRATPNL